MLKIDRGSKLLRNVSLFPTLWYLLRVLLGLKTGDSGGSTETSACSWIFTSCFLGLFFDHDEENTYVPRNVGELLPKYTVTQPTVTTARISDPK
jgi:hypothetical protein